MDRTLSQRELNRALLARQLLLDRSPAPLPRALERVGGIQAQYAPSMYFGLWSRLRDLDPAAITRGLERRTLVQATLMRSTIHLVARDDYWPLWTAIEAGRRRWWERTGRVEEKRMRAGVEKLRAALADGPLRRKEIDDLLGDKEIARGIGLYVPMVRVPPSGTWERRRADLYAAAEDWLGPNTATPDDALDRLVTRYLRAFGPATRNDVAGFAGVTVGDVAPALERLELRRFADGLLDVPRAPLPDPGTPAPPRLIGTWDAILLVHARRTGVLPEEHRARIFSTRTPHSFPTFLVDGTVAGTWREERGRIRLEPFGRLDAGDRRGLEEEAERLAAVFWSR